MSSRDIHFHIHRPSSIRKRCIFYHICQLDGWEEIVNDQFDELINSKLYNNIDKIFVGVAGDKEIKLPPKTSLIFQQIDTGDHRTSLGELPTLRCLYKMSKIDDFDVLYMHTKGVSWYLQNKNKAHVWAWRKYMEYFTIKKWEDCLRYLSYSDAVGVNLEGTGILYYTGNFWWSKSEYIRSLCDVDDVALPNNDHIWNGPRMKAEFWIGSGGGRLKSLHNYHKDLYMYPINKEVYAIA